MIELPFPTVDIPSLAATPRMRWGVVGTGQIATDFTAALHTHTAQRVVAVTSRTDARGDGFARTHGIGRVFTDVHAMAAAPDVDVVYVATPHRQHHDAAIAALTAGTPVLIEKPIGLTANEVHSIATTARNVGVFAAEGMWTRYLPAYRVIEELLWSGRIGAVQLAHADVGWAVDPANPGRMLDPNEGGGALLDMGIYSIWFAQFAIGHPITVSTRGTIRDDGVDLQSATLLTGTDGAIGTASSTLLATTDGSASITGTAGTIRFLDHFVFPGRFRLTSGHESAIWEDQQSLRGRDGLAHEAVAIASYIAEGRTESPLHSLDDSLILATTMDTIRTNLIEQEHTP